jgi:short-subunit dehydrogenase
MAGKEKRITGWNFINRRFSWSALYDGTEQGESPRHENHLKSPDIVAKRIINGIKHKRRNKILSLMGQLTALFQRIIPRFVDNAYYIGMAKEPHSPLK